MMSVMLSGNSEENFGEGKGTVDNATAAYYTALKYYSEGKTEIPVNEFCKSMSANFQGSKTYSKDVLSSIAQGPAFTYDGEGTVTVNAGAGDSLLSYFLGEEQNSDGSITMYGVWKDWADDIEPYFVALKVKAGKIVSYSQVDSEFNMNFFDGYGINILPKSSITLKAGLSLNG